MKEKVLKVVFVIVCVLATIMAAKSIYAADGTAKTEADLQNAITNATDGQLKLTEDYVINNTVNITANLTLDLNGHTISTGESFNEDHHAMLEMNTENLNVTIKDTSAAKTGEIKFDKGTTSNNVIDVCALFVKQGTATIESGKLTSTNPNNKWGVIEIGHGSNDNATQGHVVLKGGTISSERFGIVLEKGTLDVQKGATVKSTSATIMTKVNDGNNPGFDDTKITISGGTIESDGNNAVQNRSKGEVEISGGNITGATAVYTAGGKLEITGGTLTANGHAVKNGYEDGVEKSAAVVVNSKKDDKTSATINGATIKSTTDPIMYTVKEDNADEPLTVENAVSNRRIDSAYLNTEVELGITTSSGTMYYTGKPTDKNIENALSKAKKGDTITVLDGALALEGVEVGVIVLNKGKDDVTVNGTEVKTGARVVVEEEQDDTPKMGTENLFAIAGFVAVVTLAGVVVLNKRK